MGKYKITLSWLKISNKEIKKLDLKLYFVFDEPKEIIFNCWKKTL